jgi:hypothetical protein
MSSYVPTRIRRLVMKRAEGICEYCLIACIDTAFGCSVEHIIAEKHRGKTVLGNLAIACMLCNRFKGSDISSLSKSGKLQGLYNPRIHQWREHFALDRNTIRPLTDIGYVTVELLNFNNPASREERRVLRTLGRFPSLAAMKLIGAHRS